MRLRLLMLGFVVLGGLAVLGPASATRDGRYVLYIYDVRISGSMEATLPDQAGSVHDSWTGTIRGVGIHPFPATAQHFAVYRPGSGSLAIQYSVDATGDESSGEKPRCRGTFSYAARGDMSGGYRKHAKPRFSLGADFESPGSLLDAQFRAKTGCAERQLFFRLGTPLSGGVSAYLERPWFFKLAKQEWQAGSFPIAQLYSGRSVTLDSGPAKQAGPVKIAFKASFTRVG